jgi:hypothetical protein
MFYLDVSAVPWSGMGYWRLSSTTFLRNCEADSKRPAVLFLWRETSVIAVGQKESGPHLWFRCGGGKVFYPCQEQNLFPCFVVQKKDDFRNVLQHAGVYHLLPFHRQVLLSVQCHITQLYSEWEINLRRTYMHIHLHVTRCTETSS